MPNNEIKNANEEMTVGTIDSSSGKKTNGHRHHQHHHHSHKKHVNKKKLSLILLISLLAVILCGLLIWMAIENRSLNDGLGDESETSATDARNEAETVYIDGEAYMKKDGIYTMLVFGVDKFGGFDDTGATTNDMQCDFVALFVFDQNNKEFTIVHLNRDTMTPVNVLGLDGRVITSKVMQLALAHTYGGGAEDSAKNTVDAVSHLLYETSIDGYMAITMDAVETLTDYVGGVKLTMTEDLTSINESFKEGAEVLLDGENALKFIRARSGVSDGTNISRMSRQKQFISAVVKTAAELGEDKEYYAGAISSISEYMLSDISISHLSSLADWFSEYSLKGLVSPEGENRLGDTYYEFYVNDDSLKELVKDLFYNPVTE